MTTAFAGINQEVIELPILLPEWQLAQLEDAARERNMTVGQLVRRMMNEWFAKSRPAR